MSRFPFVIANRSIVVEAKTLTNALDRVLYKHPNKFIKTTYARNVAKHLNNLKFMDLVNAHKEAKEVSKKNKKTQYFVILEADEFVVKKFDEVKPKDDVYSIWRDGQKIDEPAKEKAEPLAAEKKVVMAVNRLVTEKKEPTKKQKRLSEQIMEEAAEIENKSKNEKINSNKMETKTKKAKPAKKAAKKVVAKKETAKKNGVKVEKKKVGASFFFTPDQWKQVEKILKEKDTSVNGWANELVFAKLK